jgi:hypothetical protein
VCLYVLCILWSFIVFACLLQNSCHTKTQHRESPFWWGTIAALEWWMVQFRLWRWRWVRLGPPWLGRGSASSPCWSHKPCPASVKLYNALKEYILSIANTSMSLQTLRKRQRLLHHGPPSARFCECHFPTMQDKSLTCQVCWKVCTKYCYKTIAIYNLNSICRFSGIAMEVIRRNKLHYGRWKVNMASCSFDRYHITNWAGDRNHKLTTIFPIDTHIHTYIIHKYILCIQNSMAYIYYIY